jgi:hypothetical protein
MSKCVRNDWGCVYHACMSNDCQKEVMKKQEEEMHAYMVRKFGAGN